ncbi:Segregation and condensation protein A [bioreactor metagenome]|uniref:Segregation and condensation protein A n=1 Tax=bioreactor metagenome TaxID=1076179 RepID=A0A645EVM5_9ZZZZ|nr:segregation/condensation protein A [Erysipelotrichaceae bacterium]
MTFLVSINEFEGPLDLMLHLIKEKELDLLNLDLDILVDQYISYLHQMEDRHLEIAGEYLSELAGLLEYKSKALLPSQKAVQNIEEEDPKEKLVRRLIEYQRFKDVSQLLNQRFEERNKQLTKAMTFETDNLAQDFDPADLKGNPYDLLKAMNRCLRHLALSQPLSTRIAPNEITVEEIINRIKWKFGNRQESFQFTDLINVCRTMEEIIITFLAVLDLIKTQDFLFHIDQEELIWLKWSKTNV